MFPKNPTGESDRPRFGLTREPASRIEIIFALKSGAQVTVFHDLGEPADSQRLDRFALELAQELTVNPGPRSFADDWSHTGQRAWVDLAQVSAFAVRPAR